MDPSTDDRTTAASRTIPAAAAQSYVRHELRTPLAVIQPVLGMLLDGTAGPLTEKQSGYLRMLERNVARLADMVTSVVESGWLEIAAVPPEPAGVLIADLIEDTVRDVRARGVTRRLDISAPNGAPAVFGDRHRLGMALRNVVVNACAYTPVGGSVSVSSGLEHDATMVTIVVADTGCGVLPDDLPRVFDLGFRGEAARATGAEGLGLGLPVARALVESHGGDIVMESAVGEGSLVTISLPVAPG